MKLYNPFAPHIVQIKEDQFVIRKINWCFLRFIIPIVGQLMYVIEYFSADDEDKPSIWCYKEYDSTTNMFYKPHISQVSKLTLKEAYENLIAIKEKKKKKKQKHKALTKKEVEKLLAVDKFQE